MKNSLSLIKVDSQKEKVHLFSLLSLLILLALFLSLIQKSSAELSEFEILIGALLITSYSLGIVKLFALRRNLPKVLFYLLVFAFWTIISVGLALVNGVELEWSLRRFFPVFSLSMVSLASFLEFRNFRRIKLIYTILTSIGVVIVLTSLSELHSVDVSTFANLQYLRHYGGGYFSAFSLCLALPFLFCPHFSRRLRFCIWIIVIILTLSCWRRHNIDIIVVFFGI